MEEKIATIKNRYQKIQEELEDPSVSTDHKKLSSLSQEQSELKATMDLVESYENVMKAIADAKGIIADGSDTELVALAEAELAEKQKEKEKTHTELERALLPKDPNDNKNGILEIRAGAGGDEAALFAANLFRMYTRYAENHGWKVNILSSNQIGIGGYKEIIAEVIGENVYGNLKYESGVHRVQRIPETEKQGRIHTSTATVAVLPEIEDVEVEIKPEDLRVDVFRASGHGGQSVNTTDSAVRLTHLPSGIVVSCQNERSQLKNRDQAMKVLKTRLYEAELEKQQKETGSARKIQIGTGDRSEKIRTYNFPQDRITDHRIKFTMHGVEEVLNGSIEELIDRIKAEDQKAKLNAQ